MAVLTEEQTMLRDAAKAWTAEKAPVAALRRLRATDVMDGYARARERAGELSAAPAAGGRPLGEWLELRPILAEPPTVTE